MTQTDNRQKHVCEADRKVTIKLKCLPIDQSIISEPTFIAALIKMIMCCSSIMR